MILPHLAGHILTLLIVTLDEGDVLTGRNRSPSHLLKEDKLGEGPPQEHHHLEVYKKCTKLGQNLDKTDFIIAFRMSREMSKSAFRHAARGM